MRKLLNYWTRKLHRWGAVLTALPLVLVIGSGLLLQVKKQVAWVQPPTRTGQAPGAAPQQTWTQILSAARQAPAAGIEQWQDIERLDVRPSKGVVKVRSRNGWELQLDLHSGELLSSQRRRSDFIESLHDGSFFGDSAKLWLFLPNGLVLLGLWLSGLYLWWLPIGARRAKRKARRQGRPPARRPLSSASD